MAQKEESLSAIDEMVVKQLSSDSTELLNSIDRLREIRLDKIIDLPQIIVVGNQSTGKSSVLEAISRYRFPAKGSVCTCFTTELIMRESPSPKVTVSIQYDSPGDERQREPFLGETNQDSLPSIIEQAKLRMGLGANKKFTKDVLRVEISGPNMCQLTLVDLPGIFQSSPDMSTAQNKQLVEELAHKYMRQERSIILAIIDASYDPGNQVVLDMLRKHDPEGQRTIGIITKPDCAQHGEQLRSHLADLRGGNSRQSTIKEWHVLKNTTEKEREDGNDSFELRDANETAFFETGDWRDVPVRRRGVAALRKKLSERLLEHIRDNLSQILQEIRGKLQARKTQLKLLGPSRKTASEIRVYLHDIARQYEQLVRDGISGNYNEEFFGTLDDHKNKLGAEMRKLDFAFDAMMVERGHTYTIVSDTGGRQPSPWIDTLTNNAEYPAFVLDFVERFRILGTPLVKAEAEMIRQLEARAANNWGRELPMSSNSRLPFELFKEQSKPWQRLSQLYVDLALEISKEFVENALKHVIGADTKTLDRILNRHVEPHFEKTREALDAKLTELLKPYATGYALPRLTELQRRLTDVALQRHTTHFISSLEATRPDIFQKSPPQGLDRQAIIEMLIGVGKGTQLNFTSGIIIAQMLTYYEMSRETFTDNIINLAVGSTLISDLGTLLSMGQVAEMSDENLRDLAEESEDVRSDREMLQEEIGALEESEKRCKEMGPRNPPANNRTPPVARISDSAPPVAESHSHTNGTAKRTLSPEPQFDAVVHEAEADNAPSPSPGRQWNNRTATRTPTRRTGGSRSPLSTSRAADVNGNGPSSSLGAFFTRQSPRGSLDSGANGVNGNGEAQRTGFAFGQEYKAPKNGFAFTVNGHDNPISPTASDASL